MLNLENKYCVVVGGGKIATRKIASLIAAKAKITVISIDVSNEISRWANEGLINVEKRGFQEHDVKDAFLVIAATNHSAVNLQVYNAIHSNQLINIVDHPELCSFIVPTVLNRGKLSIAISTSGCSPSLAQKIKAELQEIYDVEYESYLEFLDECRKQIKLTVKEHDKRTLLYKDLLDPIYLSLTREEKIAERNRRFADYIRNKGGEHE